MIIRPEILPFYVSENAILSETPKGLFYFSFGEPHNFPGTDRWHHYPDHVSPLFQDERQVTRDTIEVRSAVESPEIREDQVIVPPFDVIDFFIRKLLIRQPA